MFTPGNRKRSFDLYGKKKWDRNPVMSRVIRLPFDIGYQPDRLAFHLRSGLDPGFLLILWDFSFIASFNSINEMAEAFFVVLRFWEAYFIHIPFPIKRRGLAHLNWDFDWRPTAGYWFRLGLVHSYLVSWVEPFVEQLINQPCSIFAMRFKSCQNYTMIKLIYSICFAHWAYACNYYSLALSVFNPPPPYRESYYTT